MSRNIGMELNVMVGKFNRMLLKFIPPTFNAYIKDSKCLQINIKGDFSNSMNTIACLCTSFKD